MIQGHGGNIYELARELGCAPTEIVDLSSNVNPLGPPDGLIDFLSGKLSSITALPEVDAGGIRQAFARRHGIDADRVVAGNGTTQLIYALPQALASRKALVLVPAYADYADACVLHNVPHECLTATPDTDFRFSKDQVTSAIAETGADLVFICNPNNPTGVLMPSADIVEICDAHPQVNFVIDESYLPFVPNGGALSLIHQAQRDNLIMLNSMSKIFRIPGLRIGFAVAAPAMIVVLEKQVPPWSINSLSQAGVDWLMTKTETIDAFIDDTVTALEEEKLFLKTQLAACDNLTLFPSTTSFILVSLSAPLQAEAVCRHLAQHRMLIRNCANFAGLSSRYIRISLKTRAENERLVDVLRQYVS